MRRTRRGATLVGCMLAMGTVALDSTVIATAIPSIVRDLDGFASAPWLFAVYFFGQTASTPTFGSTADIVGRRPVMLLGALLFVAGALLSSTATGMVPLIAARGLQGVGAGAIQPVIQTIVGDLYPLRERARAQGTVASVWGISAILGPVVGGLLVTYADWRATFYLGMPVGVAAVCVILAYYHEPRERPDGQPRRRPDLTGAALLSTAVGLVVVGLLRGGDQWAWASGWTVATFGTAGVLAALFLRHARRTADPLIPVRQFRGAAIIAANCQAVVLGFLMMGATAYLPTFAQSVLGAGPVLAGITLGAMSIGWPLGSVFSARLYMRVGFRNTALAGSVISALACAGFTLLTDGSALWQAMACSAALGAGIGLQTTPLLVGVQHLVERDQRGVITGTFVFNRTMGSAIGAAVYGAVAQSVVGWSSGSGLVVSSHRVFLSAALVSLVGLLVGLATPHFGPGAADPGARV